MTPASIDVITIGARDIDAAGEFYRRVFACTVTAAGDEVDLRFEHGRASTLRLHPWTGLADQLGEDPESAGFRGFTLSYLLPTADDVDALLARVERTGGVVSKPPKTALWGYSAYITDPAGVPWKIASTKRKPLFSRRHDDADSDARPAPQATEVPITIGVADVAHAKDFYRAVLAADPSKDYKKFVSFDGGPGSDLGIYQLPDLAADAGVAADGHGFRGLVFDVTVGSATELSAALDRAAAAGAHIRRAGDRDGWFVDDDAFCWRIRQRHHVPGDRSIHPHGKGAQR